MRTGLIADTLACVVAAAVFNFLPRRTRRSQRKEAKMRLAIMLGIIAVACVASGAVQVPEGYKASAINQNCGGGIDYLPDGDIIGMYMDLAYTANSYIVRVDANADGSPATAELLYDFGAPVYGSFIRVSPDGGFALFGESTSGTIYRMNLSDNAVQPVKTVAFNYDLAFIDSGNCYLSASPGGFGSPNIIYHWNLTSDERTEVVRISDAPSGPISVDAQGNLYYVKGTLDFPAPPASCKLLRFSQSALSAVLNGAPKLGEGDAVQLAILDYGYDIVWHSSGALFVSDSNKGKIYKVGTDGKVSDFCVRAAGSSDSYTYLALYSRDSSFGPNESTPAKLAFAYTDWATASAVYQVTSIAPPAPEAIQLNCNGKIFHAGDRFALSIAVQPTTQPFDAYVVFRGPGVSYSLTPRGLVKGVKAYAVAVPVLRQAVTKDLLDMPIPAGVPAGTWTIYAGLMPKGTAPSPTKAFALDSVEVTVK